MIDPHDLPALGVVLPRVTAATVAAQAAEAESAGAGAIWLTDHLFWHEPTIDVVTALPLALAATERCIVGPGVLQLPLRATAATAKSMAFLDALAPGRVVVGVGVGEHEAEYEAAGLADRYHRRGRLLDAAIDDLRAGWRREGDLAMAPSRTLPIWVGGRSEPARRRAAVRGDGWFPHLCRPSWFAGQAALLDQDLEVAGRAGAPFARAAVVAVSVDGVEPDVDPLGWLGSLYRLPPRVFGRVLVTGSPDEVATELHRFREAGAHHVAAMVAGDRPAEHLAALAPILG